VVLLLQLFPLASVFGQEVEIGAVKTPLNEVLIGVRDRYGVQFSFDDKDLSQYLVTVNKHFSSPETALDYLLRDLPLDYELSGSVYLIYPKPVPVNRNYLLKGQVLDITNQEPLPFAHIIINGKGQVTNEDGYFSTVSNQDSLFIIKAMYLGYYMQDTLLQEGSSHLLFLTPSVVKLKEVVITDKEISRSGQIGAEPGTMKLNHQVARYLPGNGDNSVFNLLRLQPGILAAGEQSSDLIIWGGYEGHSQVLFDGFTVFGLKNFNDNISAVNPYLAKDIEVLKGGYSAQFGERVGGIVNISGVTGNPEEADVRLTVNNMTMNAFASVPVLKTSSVIIGYRRTYYNLYDQESISLYSPRNISQLADIIVYPDYVFHDLNIKYAGRTASGDAWHISYFQGKDRFFYSVDQEQSNFQITMTQEELSSQIGSSARYSHRWKNGGSTSVLLNHSGLEKDLYSVQTVTRLFGMHRTSEENKRLTNEVRESAARIDHHQLLSENQQADLGGGFIFQHISLIETDNNTIASETDLHAPRFFAYLQDRINLFHGFYLTPGLRSDLPLSLGKVYLQPRLSAVYQISENWRWTAAWGIYNQFISETSLLDEAGNYTYFWSICDNDQVPVLKGIHYVSGVRYTYKWLQLNIDAYFKSTDGITRWVYQGTTLGNTVYTGDARSFGSDIMLKGDFGRHSAWVSWSLGKVLEHYPYFPSDVYLPAPQDQRHEVKTAVLLNFSPFYLSVNYVYGSGFPVPVTQLTTTTRQAYSRLDGAIVYRFNTRLISLESGISVMNILNTENLKYTNFVSVPTDQTTSVNIHAEAVPFTPTLYLNLSF